MPEMPNFETFNFEKKAFSDAECPQESNGAICFLYVVYNPPPNRV